MKTLALIIIGLFLLAGCVNVQQPPEQNTTELLNPGYHEVIMDDFFYKPKAIVVYEGDRVKWINNMPFKKSVWIWGEEASPLISPGRSWSFVFTEAGFYKYRDRYNQDMEGNVTVLPYEERPDVKAQQSTGPLGP